MTGGRRRWAPPGVPKRNAVCEERGALPVPSVSRKLLAGDGVSALSGMRVSFKLAARVAAFLSTALVAAALVPASLAAADPPLSANVAPIEGYAWGWQPANPSYFPLTGYEYNSTGGAVQILRSAVGRYQVRFIGMAGSGGVAHVSAYGANNICTVSSWGPSLADEVVNVRCFTAAGAAVDSRFIAHVTNRTDGASRGYLWSSDPTPPAGGYVPPAQYSYDSTGQPIAVHPSGVGSYAVELGAFAQDFPGAWASGALRVTAYGSTAVTCQVSDPALYVDPEVLRVQCFDVTGSAVNSRFALSYTGGVVPVSATVDNYFQPATVAGWSSPSGVAPVITEYDDGDYLVSFPGAGAPGGHAFASVMATPPMFCVIHSWTVSLGAQNLRVRCYQPGGGHPNPAMMFNVGFLT